jgi:hypothetical protein
MKLIIHTKYGKFEGEEVPYDDKKYEDICLLLKQLNKLSYVSFNTANGEIHMTKSMIEDCIVEFIK